MRKACFIIVLFVMLGTLLNAVPQPLHTVPALKGKDDSFGADKFHLWGSTIYAIDNSSGTIRVWDTNEMAFTQLYLAKLPSGAIADDVTGNENGLYILDSKNSCIYVYSYDGVLQRSISTKGTPDTQFKKAVRLLVNYQGYFYVLDAGREELMAFTNEGMIISKVAVTDPISMCIGQDQILRVLSAQPTYSQVQLYDLNLNPKKGYEIQTIQSKKDAVADIAVNQYNELYVIYSGSTKIGKVNAEGRIVSKSTWGYKDKGDAPSSFLVPSIVRCYPLDDNVLMAVLDSKQNIIRLFKDTEFTSPHLLTIPEYTMRPALEETSLPPLYDYVSDDSLEYYIYDAISGNKPTRAITCKEFGNAKYTISALALAEQGIKSFDALAVYKEKLFVADSKSHTIFIFNKRDGLLLDSFGMKGSIEGRLNVPSSMVVTTDGVLYVAEMKNYRISIFNNNMMFIGSIDLKERKLAPEVIRLKGHTLLMLANGNSIYEIPLANPQQMKPVIQDTNISGVDYLHENRIGYINAITQQLVILNDNNVEYKYFAKNTKAQFPNFANIFLMRYNDTEKSVLISDRGANTARKLRFIYNPSRINTIRLRLNSEAFTELSWDAPEGINKWRVTQSGGGETIQYEVSQPKMVIREPQKYEKSYTVTSFSEDGRFSSPSDEVKDAYSYARFLSANGNYSQAVLAYKKAAAVIKDPRIDEEIIQSYFLESRFFTSQQEYEQALTSMESAMLLGGQRLEFLLEVVKNYKLTHDYQRGITYLEKFKSDNNQDIQLQLISLYYFSKNYAKVQTLATAYINKFQKDAIILQYLALANENLGNYVAALANMRELITIEDSYDNNLKIAELLVANLNLTEAMSHLQLIINRFKEQSPHAAYKLMGDIHFAMGNYPYAEDYYSDAIRMNKGNADYYYSLARAFNESRKSAEALSNFASAWELCKDNVKYGFAYAEALQKASQFPEALAVLDTINPFITTDASTTSFHELYYDLLTLEQRYDDAYREIQLAANYAPYDSSLQDKLLAATVARDHYNKNKPDVEIRAYSFQDLYPSLQAYYRNHSIGSVTLFNNRNLPIQNVKIQVTVPQISDYPFEKTIQTLLVNQETVVEIVLPINKSIFDLCKNGAQVFRPVLTMDYTFYGNAYHESKDQVLINALGTSAMDWGNRKQFASFINPNDEYMRDFVSTSIVQLFANNPAQGINKNILRAIQIWSYLHANGISYVLDNTSSNAINSEHDYVQYPFQSLSRKSGDCEDLLALMATMLSVVGVECGFIDYPKHVMLVFDTGMSSEEIMESGIDPSHFVYLNSKYWVPLETTQLGKGSFSESWLNAIKYYENILDQGAYLDLIEFSEAHKQYPPAPFSGTISSRQFGKASETLAFYKKDMESITLLGQITREEEFRQSIAKYPNNLVVANQYAYWCMQNGKISTAEGQWVQILNKDPKNLSALVNLGNLYFVTGQYAKARTQYQNALKENHKTDMVLRNLCVLEYRQGNNKQAREYFDQLKDRNVIKNLDLKLYSDLMNQGE
ncbi:MAG: tetratricopeptide repeat protein [Candidatus Cloacimonetes bacterium]|nr:tetratricopeptide repeat protein [Candidatus Cloacimonadota bacterium]